MMSKAMDYKILPVEDWTPMPQIAVTLKFEYLAILGFLIPGVVESPEFILNALNQIEEKRSRKSTFIDPDADSLKQIEKDVAVLLLSGMLHPSSLIEIYKKPKITTNSSTAAILCHPEIDPIEIYAFLEEKYRENSRFLIRVRRACTEVAAIRAEAKMKRFLK